jgi:RNA polymerase sigma factor (sigma-70 family)
MSDDQALLVRYTDARDAEAFSQLVKRYSSLVFSVASRVTGNAATAEDVTQDCFMKLACRAGSIRGSLPAWLHRMALNRSLQIKRNEARRQTRENLIVRPSDADYEVSWNQIAPFVDAALAGLPDELREPLVQHFLLDRTQSQVAGNLQIDQGTVSRRLQAGIERLRAQLKRAGVICGAASLSASLSKNASAAVPARLSASLAKMAIAGPGKTAAMASITTILIAKAKLIAAVAAVIVAGGVLTYGVASLMRGESSKSALHCVPRPYLSSLVLEGDGLTQDSVSLTFQAAANILGREADYETVYALSSNAFCPAIELNRKDGLSYWHVQSWLGDRAMDLLCARYGIIATSHDIDITQSDATDNDLDGIYEALELGRVVLITNGWAGDDSLGPWAGIITDIRADGGVFGATINGRLDNPLRWPRKIWILSPGDTALSAHKANVTALRLAVARIRGQMPFQATSRSAYGLEAMDAWIRAMTETPGFCPSCFQRFKQGSKRPWDCARSNASTAQMSANVSARYLRAIASGFSSKARQHLEAAAARYDRIASFLTPAIAATGPESYDALLGDLNKQRIHAAKVLTPIKTEYASIAHDLELALTEIELE